MKCAPKFEIMVGGHPGGVEVNGPAMGDYDDRRAHTRHPCLISAAFYFDGEIWRGTVLNYSESGVFLTSKAPVREGDTVLLRFRRPDDSETIQVQGMVARVSPAGGSREFGAQLFELMGSLAPSAGPSDGFPDDVPDTASYLAERTVDEPVDLEMSEEPLVAAPPDTPLVIEPPGPPANFRARESRFVFHIPCNLLSKHRPGEKVPAQIHNVSRRGAFIQTEVELARGDVVGLVLDPQEVDGGETPLELYAEISWTGVREVPEGRIAGLGCQLTRSREADGWWRWEQLLRALLTTGNPIFRTSIDNQG
jgi:Tfp pilus assembly protein PilZ